MTMVRLICLLLVVCAKYGAASPQDKSDKHQPVCQTEACINRANYLLHLMDPRVNPCDDFYKFTCGSFMRNTELPQDTKAAHIIQWMTDYTQSQLVGMLLEKSKPGEPQAHANAKIFYQLCMDEQAMERRGVEPLLEKLKAAGGWPVLGNWNSDNWSLLDTELRLRDFGIGGGSLFDVTAEVFRQDRPRILMLSFASVDSDLAHGEGHPVAQATYDYMVNIAVLLGADRETAENQLTELLYFEIQLAKFVENVNYGFTTYGLDKLTKEAPWFDWSKFLNNTVGKSVTLKEDELILVKKPEYYKKLGEFLSNYSNEVIANYMLWGAVERSAAWLTSEMRSLNSNEKPRWEQCLDFETSRMPLALSSLFVSTFKETKKTVETMTEKLRQELLRILMEVEWLDDETRLILQEKLVRMGREIAYPEELEDSKTIDAYYEKLSMNKIHFFEAVLDLNKWITELGNSKLREKSTLDWTVKGEMSRMVNAYNDIFNNNIGIPAGIIHNPFYDPGVPDFANYGSLGVVIGHEIVHSFDNEGVRHDAVGKIVRDHWKKETMEIFKKKKQCIIDQYGNFTDIQTNLTLGGEQTQGENIADNGGFKMAYRAYKRLVGNRVEASLPGLQHYSNDQLFMISFAALWCSKMTREQIELRMRHDEHSPGHFRVLGVAMNLPEFAEAFHCKKGDRMNPPKKCVVW